MSEYARRGAPHGRPCDVPNCYRCDIVLDELEHQDELELAIWGGDKNE